MNKILGAAAVAALGIALPVAGHADGAALFEQNCTACHAAGGVGTPGLAPPLVIHDFWAKLGDKAPQYISGVIAAGLTGKINAGGMDYIGLAMPAQEQLSDAEAAEVATYVLQSFGQVQQSVTEEQVKTARATPPAHADLRKMRKGE